MGLEQLLPGGLYKATAKANNEFQEKSKIQGMTTAHKVEGIIYEVLRDISVPLGAYIISSSDYSAERKTFEACLLAINYVGMSYILPIMARGKNSVVTNYRTRKIVSMIKKKRGEK